MATYSQPVRRSHAERTQESDEKMLAAAVRLIRENGLEHMTLKAVGEQAGYSRGLAGYRFGSKQGLFEFVMRSVGEQWLAQLRAATEGRSGVEAMTAAVRAHCALCCQNDLAVQAFYMLWLAAVNPSSGTRSVVQNINQRRQHDVMQWVYQANPAASETHAEAIAAQFSATIIGIVYHWLANPADTATVTDQHNALIHTMMLLMHPGKSS